MHKIRFYVVALMVAATMLPAAHTARAQSEEAGIELNMLRPEFKLGRALRAPQGDQALVGGAVAINFTFDGTVPVGHQAFFTAAAATWVNRIPNYKTGVSNPGGITISVSEPAIDGPGGILGSAGPSTGGSALGTVYVLTGQMQFDAADVANLITAGLYDDVIEHEMGHVLGIGTLWTFNSLYVTGSGQYTGANALTAWQTYFSGQGAATFVPVELGGGSGTANGHWDEVNGGAGPVGITNSISGLDMQFETMTGWLNGPLDYTALTHRSMADLGYLPNAGLVPVELSKFNIE